MNYYESHSNAFGSTMDDLGETCPTIFWGGKTIRIIPSQSDSESKELELGGFALNADFAFVAKIADFGLTVEAARGSIPQTILIYNERRFKVQTVSVTESGEVAVSCNAVDQSRR